MNYYDLRATAEKRLAAKDYGVILRRTPGGKDGWGIRNPWLFKADGEFFMHYDAAGDDTVWSGFRAVSRDLVNWEKEGIYITAGNPGDPDSTGGLYGIPFEENGVWYLFYIGTPDTGILGDEPNYNPKHPYDMPPTRYSTLLAKSDNPRGPWIKQKEIPFYMKEGTYYSLTASSGCVIKYGGEYMMFFSASAYGKNPVPGDTYNCEKDTIYRTLSIARAKSPEGPWTVDEKPTFPPAEQIENSYIYYQQSTEQYFLFTNHVGISDDGKEEYTDAIWVYWTKDPNVWDLQNKAVVIDAKTSSWADLIIGLPGGAEHDGKLALLYDGNTENGSTSHYHRSIGLAYLDLPIDTDKVK